MSKNKLLSQLIHQLRIERKQSENEQNKLMDEEMTMNHSIKLSGR